jgi:hypothetical protein
MSIRNVSRLLVVSLVALILVVPAEGQRRRAVGKHLGSVVTTPQCHTFGFVKAGLKASYVSTTPTASANFTITYISDTATQTKTTQVVTTPQGSADAVTTLIGESLGTLRGIKHIDVDTTVTVPVLGKLTTEINVDFVPSLIAGPLDGWCVGNTWNVPPVTETITTNIPFAPAPSPIVRTTVGSTGEVLAVGESVTVPAGTFNTVKYKGVLVGEAVQPAITWVSMEHNIVVKQDSLDAVTGAIVNATRLTNLVVPPASVLHVPEPEDFSHVSSGTH